jgi:hypothetical protein
LYNMPKGTTRWKRPPEFQISLGLCGSALDLIIVDYTEEAGGASEPGTL